jgi:hypothetical protein
LQENYLKEFINNSNSQSLLAKLAEPTGLGSPFPHEIAIIDYE